MTGERKSGQCDGEDCEYSGPLQRKLRWMFLCDSCFNFYRCQDAHDSDYEDYVFGCDYE